MIAGLVAGLLVSGCSQPPAPRPGGGSDHGRPSAVPSPAVRPAGDIPFPRFSYPVCGGPQSADGSCFLPRQPAPARSARARYASDYTEMNGLLTACVAAHFSNCARAGYHYLGASGSPITISVAALYRDVPGFRGQLQSWLREHVATALRGLRRTPPGRSASAAWDSGGATREWGSFDAAQTGSDWHYTLGKFWVRMAGDAWIGQAGPDGDRPVQIRYRTFVWDIYNFDAGSRFQNLEDLAKAGMAADFLVTGESKTEVISGTVGSVDPDLLVAEGS